MNAFNISNDGTIVFVCDNKAYTVNKDHTNYFKILTAIKARKFHEAVKFADVADAIRKVHSDVTVEDGHVLYRGRPVGGVVVERIQRFIRDGLPYEPLVAFLANLQENPSSTSVNELYQFLEHSGFSITEDGHFIAYKGITSDWKDKYTQTVDNSIGQKPSMPRNQVDDNRDNTCSHGYHAGTFAYATNYAGPGGRVVLVKINPADCVSVPSDHNAEKLRVWQYEVVAEAPEHELTAALVDASGSAMGACLDCDEDYDDCTCAG